METFLLLLLFPIAWPFIAKRIWHTTINWTEMTIQIFGVVFLVSIVWAIGTYSATRDVEIWNGEIISKDRIHDHYLRSYDCNCSTDSNGNRSCSTCYEDRYTVEWKAESTVGRIVFNKLDRSSKRVYLTPDPLVYVNCKVGEPASLEHSYTNYVRAAPDSLFNNRDAISKYADKVPQYPRVHNFYKITRVLTVDANIPANIRDEINTGLNERLKTLGGALELNVVVIITGIDDPSYRFAVENAWIGGKKNDAVVFIGVDEQLNITWADVMTFALNKGNELFHVRLRDALKETGTVKNTFGVVDVIANAAVADFARVSMKDFEYLKDDVNPPTWVIFLSIFFAIGGSIGLSVLFHYKEVEDTIGDFFTRKTRKRNRRYYR